MGINRLIVAEIDARNPRTAECALRAGRISKKTVVRIAITNRLAVPSIVLGLGSPFG